MDELYNYALRKALGLGSIKNDKILDFFNSAYDIFNASDEELLLSEVFDKKSLEKIRKIDFEECKTEVANLNKKNVKIVSFYDTAYPKLLSEIHAKPILLFRKGQEIDFSLLPTIAIVGTRNVSMSYATFTFNLAASLANFDIPIVSGGALGVDSFAHEGALSSDGITVIIEGCGILHGKYLTNLHPMREKAQKNGCIFSEFMPYETPTKYSFPLRNRIISGLCDGTVIVEAQEKSGSLITAKYAKEQNRDVFAVPAIL